MVGILRECSDTLQRASQQTDVAVFFANHVVYHHAGVGVAGELLETVIEDDGAPPAVPELPGDVQVHRL